MPTIELKRSCTHYFIIVNNDSTVSSYFTEEVTTWQQRIKVK